MMRSAIIGLVASAMAAASAFAGPVDQAYTAERPDVAPIRAGTGFDTALRCMDDMLSRTGYGNNYDLVPTMLMEPKGDIGAATRDMIVAAASRMSEKSRFFKIHPFVDPNSLRSGALIVHGSITEFDKAVTGKGTGGGFGAQPLGIGLRSQRQDAVLTVTLYFTDREGVLVPGTAESVSMALTQSDKGGDLTGEIGPVGGFFELDFTHSDGIQQAVRALIDLAMTQAVGAFAQVPYQRCLTTNGADPDAIRAARKAFDKMKPGERIQAIAKALAQRNTLAEPISSVMDQGLRQAIADYEAQQGLPPLGLPTFEVYYSLYQRSFGAPAAPIPTSMTSGPGVKITPYGPGVRIRPDGFLVLIGDRVTFAITVIKPASVACFYTDGLGRTTKVFPNLQRQGSVVQPGETLLIPGPLDVFTIEPSAPSTAETVTCLAGEAPFVDQLPSMLKTSLQLGAVPLAVHGPDEIVALAQRAVSEPLSVDRVVYTVCDVANQNCAISRPAASPTPPPVG